MSKLSSADVERRRIAIEGAKNAAFIEKKNMALWQRRKGNRNYVLRPNGTMEPRDCTLVCVVTPGQHVEFA